jgi:hypothetical protein
MARHHPGLLAFLSAFITAAALKAQAPPPAPEGYSWKKLDAIKAAFLMPNGWHFKEETHGTTLAYFFSEENIDAKGEFETGLTLNVIHLQEDKAQERAVATLAALAQTPGNELQDAWETETGVLKGIGGRIRTTEKGHLPLMMVMLAIGNARTNTLYLLLFESPESRWKQAWEKGEKMLKLLMLDDEY